MRGAVLALLPLLATLGWGVALAADNIVPVEVRQLCHSDRCNKLFVELTVCDAKRQCRTVPNVLVDTGSPGLRLFRDALDGLALDPVRTVDRRPLGNWSSFGSGELWGTMHWAQVRLGDLATTEAIPIELFDEPSPDELLPAGYGSGDLRGQLGAMVGNGILGISPHRHSPDGYFVYVGPGRTGWDADWFPVQLDKALQLANPIAHFPAPYDNGSVIHLPEVDWCNGQRAAQGWLGFGLGPPTAVLFPQDRRVIAQELDKSHRFPLTLAKRQLDVTVDSGTNLLVLDLEHLGWARHGYFENCYDPAALVPVELAVGSTVDRVKLARPLYVGPADKLSKMFQGYAVLPTIATWPDPQQMSKAHRKKKNILGLPFFYGRAVATGLEGVINPYLEPAPASALQGAGNAGADRAMASRYGFVAYSD